MKIVLLGSPGVGKGTYANRLQEHYHISQISTGDIFRQHINDKTKLAEELQIYMSKGELVPDPIVIEEVKLRLHDPDAKKGFMLDGFPRTLAQAKALESISAIDVALLYEANTELIVDRLSGRRICSQCRAIFHIKNPALQPKTEGICDKCGAPLFQREDDQAHVIRERIKVYYAQTGPIIEYYQKLEKLVKVDASTPDVRAIVEESITDIDRIMKFKPR